MAHHRTSGGGRHRVLAPPPNKVAWITASVAGAAVAAFGSGVPAGSSASTTTSADVAALSNVAAAPAEAPMHGQSAISAAVAHDRAGLILASSRTRREALRPHWVRPGTGIISSGYGARWGTFHYGVDLAAPYGSPEYAAGDGVVIDAGPASGFGQWVVIQHANGDCTVYGHMSKILVHIGERVQAGQLISLVGSEGESTGPHLHFEVRLGGINGERTDPIAWMAARGVRI